MISLRPDSTQKTANPPRGVDPSQSTGLLDRYYQVSVRPVPDATSANPVPTERETYPLYRRLDVAREISQTFDLDLRVEMCGLYAAPGQNAEIVRHSDGRHGFANLMRCGSVWQCPVCRSRIAGERAEEINTAIVNAHAQGLRASLVTLTVQHSANDTLPELLEVLKRSLSPMLEGRPGQRLKESMGYAGRIRAVEVKYNEETGWHPHYHLLIFHSEEFDGDAFFRRWQLLVEKNGRIANRGGFDVQPVLMDRANASRVAGYLSKTESLHTSWGIGDEMAASHAKHGKGETPEQLLERAGNGDADAIEAWIEYAHAMKGVSALRWSPGLRDALGLGKERTDEEIASEKTEEGETVRVLSVSEQFALVASKRRAAVLDAANKEGAAGIERVIAEAMEAVYGKRRSPFAA